MSQRPLPLAEGTHHARHQRAIDDRDQRERRQVGGGRQGHAQGHHGQIDQRGMPGDRGQHQRHQPAFSEQQRRQGHVHDIQRDQRVFGAARQPEHQRQQRRVGEQHQSQPTLSRAAARARPALQAHVGHAQQTDAAPKVERRRRQHARRQRHPDRQQLRPHGVPAQPHQPRERDLARPEPLGDIDRPQRGRPVRDGIRPHPTERSSHDRSLAKPDAPGLRQPDAGRRYADV
jgi:hypothetical protein